jgi:hypothetical protein
MKAPKRVCIHCGMALRVCFVRNAHIKRTCCLKCDHIIEEINPS